MEFSTIKEQVSAGGVVYREENGQLQVVLISVGDEERWQLPKGTLDEDETIEMAAQREVLEETGLHTRMVCPIDRIEYWFTSRQAGERSRVHKYVYFFLFEYESGDTRDHDGEVNDACWMDIEQAIQRLKFDNEKVIVKKSMELIPAT